MERPQEQAPVDQVGNACDKNDRDDLDEEEDEPADDTFKEKIEKDLQLLIKEICSKANQTNQQQQQQPSITPGVREEKEKEDTIHPKQMKVAGALFKKIKANQPHLFDKDHGNIKYFDVFAIVPKFRSLGRQTVERLKSFIESKKLEKFLQDLQPDLGSSRVEEHVIRNAARENEKGVKRGSEAEKMRNLKKRILEEKQTLFFVVHDEAHCAPLKNKHLDRLINDKDLRFASNFILLQVSATPYCLVTKNTRIQPRNHLDMYREVEENSTYYGIGQFVEETSKTESEDNSSDLVPGTLQKDEDFETSISSVADGIHKYVCEVFNHCSQGQGHKEKKKGQTTRESEIEHETRFLGLVFQWIKALLEKANFSISEIFLKSKMAKFIDWRSQAKITEAMLKDIDNPDGTGKMVLVRLLLQREGRILVDTMRDLRNALGLQNGFCVSLDCDDDTSSGEKLELCEPQFLPRLQAWKNDKEYRPTSYTDLKDLPVILVVVEKGKMGITYPKSLRFYDLRMRYVTTSNVTRGAIEQDFGRACRYKCEGDPPLPTVIVSKAAKEQLLEHDMRQTRKGGRFKPTGVYKLRPDYPKYMEPSEQGGQDNYPTDESNLNPYHKWTASKKHWDVGNTEKADNRYLLVGRPQIGKTGVFLHLAFLLWREVGSPEFTSPTFEEVEVIQPVESEDGDEVISPQVLVNMEQYPNFNVMKKLVLEKCPISSRYGDPSDEKVRRHYLVEGKQYPYPGALIGHKNTLMKRQTVTGQIAKKDKENKEIAIQPRDNVSFGKALVNTQFSSKAITGKVAEMRDVMKEYQIFPVPPLGTLYLRQSELALKWDTSKWPAPPTIAGSMRLPPIIIPSYGRSKTALLDLTKTMEGNKEFVEIVVVRDEEKDEYLKTAFLHPPLDVFVMNENGHNTIGEARMVAKKLGEQITAGKKMNFIFLLDDNILCWQGVTLINDPHPMFGLEPSHITSQRTDISLLSLLKHFSGNAVEDFNIIGFSIGTHKSITRRKLAYGRKHVMAAVLLNLPKSKGIEYNAKAWAMEDIDFNLRTNERSSSNQDQGVIVKCLRYVATKAKLPAGGVVPSDPPEDVKQMMKEAEEWTGVAVRERGEKTKDQRSALHAQAQAGSGNVREVKRENDAVNEESERKRKERKLAENAKRRAEMDKEDAERRRKMAENDKRRAEMDKEDADIRAELAMDGEFIPTQESASPFKRSQPESEDDDKEKKFADAEESLLLPKGLSKQGGQLNKSVYCNKTGCDDCRYITKPFQHFAVNKLVGKHTCHLCELYESDELFLKLAKMFAKKQKLKFKKKKR